ncbi:hypothetical protein F4677DRAFT_364942 [Hypoxylon crocopeplum]|nr:hypothetical protein F4677DRAFT_364942 [Hypoxylon crocopeplum]
MDSITHANCTLGLISFSLENPMREYQNSKERWKYIPDHNWKLVEEFASAIEELLEVLETLDTSPHNPMVPLPQRFQTIADKCARDMEKMRRGIKKYNDGLTWSLELKMQNVITMTSAMKSHTKYLRPYVETLSGGLYPLQILQDMGSATSSAAFKLNIIDDIDTNGRVPGDVGTIAKSLCTETVNFSAPQLYQLLKILKELGGSKFPEHEDQIGDHSWRDLKYQLQACKKGLCATALSSHPEHPTPEGRDAIIALQRLVLALQSSPQNDLQSTVPRAGKRKAEAEDKEAGSDHVGLAPGHPHVKYRKIDIGRLAAMKTLRNYWLSKVEEGLDAKGFD